MNAAAEAISTRTRWVDDFPTAGVRFADLTPVLMHGPSFRTIVDAMADTRGDVDLVAAIDARGFLLGAAVARALDVGVLAVRKKGKLPPPVRSRDYALEYAEACLEIPHEIDLSGHRVLLIDDVLATGGTLGAVAELLADAGAEIAAISVVLEITALGGRGVLRDHQLSTVLTA